jgi:hypothetical protein
MCWSVHDHKRKLIFEDARYVRTTAAFVNQFLTRCTFSHLNRTLFTVALVKFHCLKNCKSYKGLKLNDESFIFNGKTHFTTYCGIIVAYNYIKRL